MASMHWTFEDVRKNASNWNLEGDSQLLELMKNISDNLLKRANATASNVNTMGITLEKSCIAFENASNKLSALSKTQFVESRVHDDDEIKPKRDFHVESEKNTYNPNETIKTILHNNLNMLEKCYEKVSLDLQDSDEEDEQISSTIIYRPKNCFTKRLPALIGTKEWNEKWHIGLIDSDDESISEKENEEFSDDSAENISLPSIGPTISESGSSVWSINRIYPITTINTKKFNNKLDPSSDEEAISSNTFVSKTSSEEIRKIKSDKINQINEQKYYIHKPKEKNLAESSDSGEENNKIKPETQILVKHRTNLPFVQKKSQIPPKISNIFSDEPPDLDSDESSKKSSKDIVNDIFESEAERNGYMTAGKGNFIENVIETPKENISLKNDNCDRPVQKVANLFDENDFDSLVKEIDRKTSDKTMQTSILKKVNLFDSDSELDPTEENNRPHLNANISSKVSILKNSVNEAPQLRKEIQNEDNKKNDLVLFPGRSRGLFDDFDDEDDIFLPIKSDVNKNSGSLSSALLSKTKISNLFDDEPPEDDFDNLFQTSKTKNSKISDIENPGNALENHLEVNTNIQSLPQTKLETNKVGKNIPYLEEQLYAIDDQKVIENLEKFETKTSDDSKAINVIDKNLASALFSNDWSDDEEKLFSTKGAQIPSCNFKSHSKDELEYQKEDLSTKTNEINGCNISSPQIPPIDFNLDLNANSKLAESENMSAINSLQKKSNDYQSSSYKNNVENDNKNISRYGSENNSPDTFQHFNSKKTTTENQINATNVPNLVEDKCNLEKKDNDEKNSKSQTLSSDISDSFEKIEPDQHSKDSILQTKNFQNTHQNYILEKSKDFLKKSERTKIKDELYSLLFSDTPPEDEDIFVSADRTTEHTSALSLCKTDQNVAANLYDNTQIGLFDDIPPDDYIGEGKKNVDNLFNEEFDSSANVRFENDIQSNYMISEEPPPDDYFKDDSLNVNDDAGSLHYKISSNICSDSNLDSLKYIESKSEDNSNMKAPKDIEPKCEQDEIEITSSTSVNKRISMHDQIIEQEKIKIIPEKLAQKPQNHKLTQHDDKTYDVNRNPDETDSVLKIANQLNINIAALLPGAKRPSKASENSTSAKARDPDKVISLSQGDINNTKFGNASNVTKEGKLIGLNKSRPKILVKRRPSTRKARQESYRKSIVSNEDLSDSEKEITSINKQKTRINELQNEKSNITEMAKSIHNRSEGETIVKSNVLDVKSDIKNANVVNRNYLKSNISFDKKEDFKPPDWSSQLYFNEKSPSYQTKDDTNKKSIDTKGNISKNVEPLTSKTIFNECKINISNDEFVNNCEPHKNKSKLKSSNDSEQVPVLNSDNKNYNIESCNPSASILQQNTSKNKDLVDSFDNDDDDLFSSPFVKNISAPTQNSMAVDIKPKQEIQNSSNFYDENKSEIFKKVNVTKPFSNVSKTPKQNDILNIATKKKLPINQSKGLFSSDDDEDDSLFGGSSITNSKRENHNQKTGKEATMLKGKKNREYKIRESLFDDAGDDEDDDLFGSSKVIKAVSTSKITDKTQPSRGAIPKRPIEKKFTKIEDSNNPLADLLDQ